MNYEFWINRAICKIGELQIDTEFVLKDLFNGTDWNELSSGEKRELGRQFKIAVQRGLIPHTVYIGKMQNNSAKYKKQIT